MNNRRDLLKTLALLTLAACTRTMNNEAVVKLPETVPVSSLVSGCTTMAELEHNIGVLQNFIDLSSSDIQSLEKLVEPYADLIVENYKRVLDIEN